MPEIIFISIAITLTLLSWWVVTNMNDILKLTSHLKNLPNMDTPERRNIITVIIMLITISVLTYFFNNIAAGILAAIFIFLYRRKNKQLESIKKNTLIDQQAEVGLQIISSLYEAKGDLIAAIKGASECIQPPLADELRYAIVEFSTGLSPMEVLQNLADRVENRDINIFVKGVVLSEKYGTSTAEVIKNVGEVITDRISLREEVKNEMRGQKLTINIFLISIPVVTILITAFLPDAREIIINTMMGKILIMFAITIEYLGWYFTSGQGGADEL